MNIVIDLIIAAILIFNIIYGWKKGFVKMVLSSLAFLVAVVAAFMFVTPVRDFITDLPFAEKSEAAIHEGVVNLLDNIGKDTPEDEENYAELEEKFISMLEFTGLDLEKLTDDLKDWKENQSEELKLSIANNITPLLHKAVYTCIAFVIIFIVVFIAAKILCVLLDKFTKLPVLKQANEVLGLVVGFVSALIQICVFTSVIQMAVPYNAVLGGVLENVTADNTVLYGFFSNFNIFRILF